MNVSEREAMMRARRKATAAPQIIRKSINSRMSEFGVKNGFMALVKLKEQLLYDVDKAVQEIASVQPINVQFTMPSIINSVPPKVTEALKPSAIGFKATRQDMTCRGVKFELGVEQTVNHPVLKNIVLECAAGFHYCTTAENTMRYYGPNSRIFKCIGSGHLESSYNKIAAEKITLTEEIDYLEVFNDPETDYINLLICCYINLVKQGHDAQELMLSLKDKVQRIYTEESYQDYDVQDTWRRVNSALNTCSSEIITNLHSPWKVYTIKEAIEVIQSGSASRAFIQTCSNIDELVEVIFDTNILDYDKSLMSMTYDSDYWRSVLTRMFERYKGTEYASSHRFISDMIYNKINLDHYIKDCSNWASIIKVTDKYDHIVINGSVRLGRLLFAMGRTTDLRYSAPTESRDDAIRIVSKNPEIYAKLDSYMWQLALGYAGYKDLVLKHRKLQLLDNKVINSYIRAMVIVDGDEGTANFKGDLKQSLESATNALNHCIALGYTKEQVREVYRKVASCMDLSISMTNLHKVFERQPEAIKNILG
ncbi:hypothetical protein KNT64_gp055 [Pseudomonas phage PspYZU05]|uniref:DUF7666 domain-containing protein n=1 Tax=Pseudomonas phage PspYZU05 TaxID=1983556 RepID=A0A2U7NMZ3_9CAUD|nr:hypothetical protein KNT64_gp055 [Pseudomonas phage PspYZU05]ASD52007.1 hypothetical protein PspYZU05_55 [Pseudomonas phage PspYZU05]